MSALRFLRARIPTAAHSRGGGDLMARTGRLVLIAAILFATRASAVPPPYSSAPFDVAAIVKHSQLRVVDEPQPARSTGGFTLKRRPDVVGELRMNFGSTFEVLESTSDALHLRERVSGKESWYLGALWTDAFGTATRLRAIQEGDDLVVVIPPQLLEKSTYPVVLDPEIGPEFSVAPAGGQAIAFDGTNYLTVWATNPSGQWWLPGGEIRAARVSQEGSVLDSGGTLVAPGRGGENQVSVAFNGEVYLITWTSTELITYSSYPSGWPYLVARSHLYAARLDAQGNSLDPAGILIAHESGGFCDPFVFCDYTYPTVTVGQDGTNFLIAWAWHGGLLATLVAPTGEVVSYNSSSSVGAQWPTLEGPTGEPIPVTSSSPTTRNPSIAFDGSNYFVTAADFETNDITGIKLAADGAILAGWTPLFNKVVDAPYVVSGVPTSIAFNGDVFVSSRVQDRCSQYTCDREVLVSRITRGGEVLDPVGVVAGEFAYRPTLLASVFDGCNVVVAWDDHAVRISGDGTVLDGAPWSLNGPITAMATDGAGTVLVMSGSSGQFIRTCDRDAPMVFVPAGVSQTATSSQGALVDYSASALDAVSGIVPVTCSPSSGSLFPPGVTNVTCTATDEWGNVGSASFNVAVTFGWAGVLPPINADGISIFKLGRTVPVKFQLAGASAGISDLVATLTIRKISEGVLGSVEEPISSSAADYGNQFRYDPAASQYVFNLSTSALTAGTYQARIDMGDGVQRLVQFSLRP